MIPSELVFKEVFKQYNHAQSSTTVLNNISVSFKQGKTYAITGISGTGKSTLMHILAGLDSPTSGTVYFNNNDIASLPTKQKEKFLNTSVGVVFQSPYLIRELSVLENIIMPGLIGGKPKELCLQKATLLLERVDLIDKMHSNPSSLSGGQQQRVALVRAIFNEPAFLLADEPTGNLDIKTGQQIVALLLDCHKEWNMGIIVSTHDSYVAQSMETIFKIEDGQLHKI